MNLDTFHRSKLLKSNIRNCLRESGCKVWGSHKSLEQWEVILKAVSGLIQMDFVLQKRSGSKVCNAVSLSLNQYISISKLIGNFE